VSIYIYRLDNLRSNNSGFTIIELLISSLIFSIILMTATFAVIQVSRTYIKGYVGVQTQNTNRSMISLLTNELQQSNPGSVNVDPNNRYGTIHWFCLNGQRFIYQYDAILNDTTSGAPLNKNVFVQDQDDSPKQDCTFNTGMLPFGNIKLSDFISDLSLNTPQNPQTELLRQHMQLVNLNGGQLIAAVSGFKGLYNINLKILYADTGSFRQVTANNSICYSDYTTHGFCYASSSSTTVQARSSIK
jgi:prepilin-type N-terminal cleavage/methylation domain-containing protein